MKHSRKDILILSVFYLDWKAWHFLPISFMSKSKFLLLYPIVLCIFVKLGCANHSGIEVSYATDLA